jgi:hypothetical protein
MPILERSKKYRGKLNRTDFVVLLEKKKININRYESTNRFRFVLFFIIPVKSINAKIGHRGLKVMNLRIPLLFSKAIDLQVDLIELDVHLSADGECGHS